MIHFSHLLVLLFFVRASLQNYTLSISHPFQLDLNGSNIKLIYRANDDLYFVIFEQGEARAYTSSFTTYSTLNLVEKVEEFSISTFGSLNIYLSNGISFDMASTDLFSVSNNSRTVICYSYP